MAAINPHTGKPYPLNSRRHYAFRQALHSDWAFGEGVVDCVICVQVPVQPGSLEPTCTACAEVRREGHLPDEPECPCRECLPVLPAPEPEDPPPPPRKRRAKV